MYNAEYMNTKKHKQRLEEELARLVSELGKIARQEATGNWVATPDLGDEGSHADELDNADLRGSYQERIGLVRVLEEQYIQINKALAAIEDETYGICEVGKCKISKERLEANPSATTCIEHSR